MNWYRIKTILIFLFLAINLFLAAHLGVDSLSKTQVAKEQGKTVARALTENGIAVEGEIPYKTPRLDTLTLENPKADPEQFARSVLGEKAIRMGGTWRREGKTLTILEKGFLYESGQAPVRPDKNTVSKMKAALEGMGFPMGYAKGQAGQEAVTFVQIIDGAQLFESTITVYPAADGTVSRIEGAWANVQPGKRQRTPVKSAADALLQFLQEGKKGTISRVACGYAVLRAEAGYRTADAVPVWRVECADGTIHYYDARR